MTVEDDDRWILKDHSKVKHEIFSRYLGAFVSITGRSWEEFYYIDAFAGRGRYKGGEPGSPIHALKTIQNTLNNSRLNLNIKSINCIFIEKDPTNFSNLHDNLDGFKIDKIKLYFFKDTFESVFPTIMKKFSIGLTNNPSFFFLDPFGYSGIPFNIQEQIFELGDSSKGNHGRPEIFYNLMVGAINRWWKDTTKEDHIDKLFGHKNWRNDIQNILDDEGVEVAEAISWYFRHKLESRTEAKYTLRYKFRHSETNRWIYDMIHATTHYKGLEVMKKIMYNIGVKGSFEFHGKEEHNLRRTKTLFECLNMEPYEPNLRKWLNNYVIPGRNYSFDGLKWFILLYTPFIESVLRKVLKNMEKEGKIRVKRITSKTTKGLRGQDRIFFLSEN